MNIKFHPYLLILLLFINSCNTGSENEEVYDIDGQTENGFEDGLYCAEVTYLNHNTNTENTYILEVEVNLNKIVSINWGNGGWMDEDHFTAQEIDNEGFCAFTSDREYEYSVKIIGNHCDTDESRFESDKEEEYESLICPNCGDNKYDYEEYCSACEDEIKNTCSDCSIYEFGINGGKCSSCSKNYDLNFNNSADVDKAYKNLQKSIDEGLMQYISDKCPDLHAECQQIIVKKRDKFYKLLVSGRDLWTMGTIKFDENSLNWQSVPVKTSPYKDTYEVYQMKVMESSKSLTALQYSIDNIITDW